jgi:rubredoxin
MAFQVLTLQILILDSAHYNLHFKFLPYKCVVCDLEFISEDKLLRHSKNLHKENQNTLDVQFECEVCGWESKSRHAVLKHKKNEH